MDANILNIILNIAGIIVACVLVWLIVELILIIRKSKAEIEQICNDLQPTLKNVETITEELKPVIEKVDPLVERVTLTVDAANLELMRADQILENVNVITEGIAGATTAVGNIASAPSDLINKAGEKLGDLFGSKKNKKSISSNIAGEFENSSDDQQNDAMQSSKLHKIFETKKKQPSHAKVDSEKDKIVSDSLSNNPYISLD